MERGIQICAALGKGAGGDASEIWGSLAGRQLQSFRGENKELMVGLWKCPHNWTEGVNMCQHPLGSWGEFGGKSYPLQSKYLSWPLGGLPNCEEAGHPLRGSACPTPSISCTKEEAGGLVGRQFLFSFTWPEAGWSCSSLLSYFLSSHPLAEISRCILQSQPPAGDGREHSEQWNLKGRNQPWSS